MSSRRRGGNTALNALSAGQTAPGTERSNYFGNMLQRLEASDPALAKQVMPLSDGSIQINQFKITPLGLFGGEQARVEEWSQIGRLLFQFHDSLQIILGDWLVQGERIHGKTYEQVAEEFGRKRKTLYNWKYVMSSVDISLRRENLTYKHYMIVAGMSHDQQARWLGQASEFKWSANRMQAEINEEIPPELPEPSKLHYSQAVSDLSVEFFARVERISRALDGKENPDEQAMREYVQGIEKFVAALRKSFGWES